MLVTLYTAICLIIVLVVCLLFFFFFFQAEDGIRDVAVTGVQTCALPILPPAARPPDGASVRATGFPPRRRSDRGQRRSEHAVHRPHIDQRRLTAKLLRSEEHTSELQSRLHLVCRLLLEKKKKKN